MAKVKKKAAKTQGLGQVARKAAAKVKGAVAKATAPPAKAPSRAGAQPASAKAKAPAAKAKAKAPPETKPAATATKLAATRAKTNQAAPKVKASVTIDVGSRAPSFTLKDQSGTSLSSAELSGKPYVLYFYPKDDTSGCTAEACGFRDSGPKFGERGVRIIGVSPDSEASHAKFAGKYGLPFTLLSDPDRQLIQAYGAWVEKQNYGRKYMGVQRSTFLIGADGRVQKAWRSVKVPGHVDAVLAATQG